MHLSTWFNIFLVGGGLALTSIIFYEFRTSYGRLHYLSIPASHLEKLSSRWFYSLILYPFFLFVFFFLMRAAATQIFEATGWDQSTVKASMMAYWIAHPFVFLGAVWFNKFSGAKSILVALLFVLLLTLAGYVLHRLFFSELYTGFGITSNVSIEPSQEFRIFVESNAKRIGQLLGFVILPAFFFVVSYFKLKEKEA